MKNYKNPKLNSEEITKEFKVFIGSSSKDLHLKEQFEIIGEKIIILCRKFFFAEIYEESLC